MLRQTIDGANPQGWLPDQKTTVEQALYAYTRATAFSGFMEDRTGKLASGYYADLTILDSDLLRIGANDIGKAKVLQTYVGGQLRS